MQERDIQAQYNPMSTAELEKNYPGFNFKAYLAERNIPDQDKLVVGELSYFKGLTEYFAKADLQQLKDYLAGQLLTGGCGALSDDFYNAYFDFFSRQMSGIQQQKPRWKRAMRVPNSVLGEAVGKMYVEKYFPESSFAVSPAALCSDERLLLPSCLVCSPWLCGHCGALNSGLCVYTA